ncbi:MAG: isopeptide-forming domain-containing fimbrial protein [Clostridiales bacterium]|nr:isopeptide-forming domain-containing fimbrial protein [Clostridiales bacterium]
MKKITKALSLVLALALVVMSVSVTTLESFGAYGNGSNNVTISGVSSGDVLTAYQIFSGSYNSTTQKLTNIASGSSLNSLSTFITTLKSTFTDTTADYYSYINNLDSTSSTADDVATALGYITTESADAELLVNVIKTNGVLGSNYAQITSTGTTAIFSGMEDGYYYIKTSNSSSTGFVLEVVGGTITVASKLNSTSIDKDLSDTSDYSVSPGDTVSFTVTVTLPSNLYAYTDGYSFTVTDTLTNMTFGSITSIELYTSTSSQSAYTLTYADSGSYNNENVKVDSSTAGTVKLSGTLPATYCTSVYNSGKIVFVYTAVASDTVTGYTAVDNAAKIAYQYGPET